MYLAVMVGKFVKQVVRCPSTTGPLWLILCLRQAMQAVPFVPKVHGAKGAEEKMSSGSNGAVVGMSGWGPRTWSPCGGWGGGASFGDRSSWGLGETVACCGGTLHEGRGVNGFVEGRSTFPPRAHLYTTEPKTKRSNSDWTIYTVSRSPSQPSGMKRKGKLERARGQCD